ncbi:MAG: aconitase X swivel domain-containing protein [Candidatus Bathyarchaeia archaeon]
MRFKGRVIQGWDGELVGEVLITRFKVSFLGDVDLNTGRVVGPDLDIRGESLVGRVFIFPEGRGSTVGSNVIYGLARRGLAPELLATCRAELITVSGAILGGVPMISNLGEAVFENLMTGDQVRAYIVGDEAYIERVAKT